MRVANLRQRIVTFSKFNILNTFRIQINKVNRFILMMFTYIIFYLFSLHHNLNFLRTIREFYTRFFIDAQQFFQAVRDSLIYIAT